MDASYPAKYRDRHGEVATSIHNDGHTLSMVVRDVEFSGSSLVALEPPDSCDPSRLTSFTFEKLCWMHPSGEGFTEPRDGKHDLFGIWKTMTESVQETYLCPEFQRRVPGTGYRG